MTDYYMKIWEDRRDEFHMVMGYCVAAWAEVDDQLFRIFRDCMASHDQSAIVYYRTPGLNVRLGLVTEIVITTLLPSWERPGHADHRMKAWKAAIKGSRDLLSVRRRIAHHPVRTSQSTAVGWAFAPVEIQVGEHEGLRDSAAKLAPLQIEDLEKHRIGVEKLRDRLRSFFENVLTKPPPASPPPAPPPRSLDRQQTDLAKAPRRRRRSSPP